MWERYNEVYQLNARVLSMGMLREDDDGAVNMLLEDVLYKDRDLASGEIRSRVIGLPDFTPRIFSRQASLHIAFRFSTEFDVLDCQPMAFLISLKRALGRRKN